MIETETQLGERRLRPDEPLAFKCDPGLACFTTCCRDKRLGLLPYDVLRLTRRLQCSSSDFLATYAQLEIEPASGWPTLRLSLAEDGRCPFVGERGCAVYLDRPTCCRIYPLARAVSLGADGALGEQLLVDASKERCQGFGARAELTVEGWLDDQGLSEYRRANNRVARLFLHPSRPRPLALNPAGVHAVILALYNLDVFRELVATPSFAGEQQLNQARVAEALASKESLLELAEAWLASRLFG